jgi:hypothetical protein
MIDLRQPNLVAAGGPVSKLSCRWHKASDGALVMVWSLAEATRPTLDLVSGSLAERVAIILLLGVTASLTFAGFIAEHNDLL